MAAARAAVARSRSVAVIGGGAAGLAACKVLAARGHSPVVLERSSAGVGGTWRFDDDETGTSMYASLSTNLPKTVMQFSDLPFPAAAAAHPGWADVLAYLESFAAKHALHRFLRLGCTVTACARDAPGGRWRVEYERGGGGGGGGPERLEVDAVVVANGHYSVPHEPRIEGADGSLCRVIHSHLYRRADEFRGARVVVVGGGYSGVDVANELVEVAASVSLSLRGDPRHAAVADKVAQRIRESGKAYRLDDAPAFLGRRPEVSRLVPGSREVVFADGTVEEADVVLLCTGYAYSFPFLPRGLVRVGLRTVDPLYEDVFHADVADGSLSFVGVPWQVVPFPLCEIQCEWIAAVLAGRAALPPPAEMAASIDRRSEALAAAGLPRRLLHRGGANSDHASYCRRVLEHAGLQGQFQVFDDRSLRPAEAE